MLKFTIISSVLQYSQINRNMAIQQILTDQDFAVNPVGRDSRTGVVSSSFDELCIYESLRCTASENGAELVSVVG
ncbi:hypothetical protein C438_02662 [Haloferax denitrificans ATCC 35960]|uniref:Uncharacterized protein n=1 Tax=Haloferax denitrificans ATCC 35960 TaxID=662478 RepID=M0JFV2_9EURY|nr:hypothetical protein C438_02662 [Haloferax denitrificans ATCC 35960]